MRLVFAGTPYFAERALAALLDARHEIALVLTQPDRKAGRGLRTAMSPVKQTALANGLTVAQPLTLRDPAIHAQLRSVRPVATVVVAYGLILPQAVLDMSELGALNIHASLLPRWRGAAPIQRAILAGDTQTGVTVMKMEAGLDTGPMLAGQSVAISSDDTARSLTETLAALGATMIVNALEDLQSVIARARPQPAEGVTYAHKIDKQEAALDWRKSSRDLDLAVRAFNPAPGAHARLGDEDIKIWRARPVSGEGEPGCVLFEGDTGIAVSCGVGALLLTELQRPGGKRLEARDFLRGHPLPPGTRFTQRAD